MKFLIRFRFYCCFSFLIFCVFSVKVANAQSPVLGFQRNQSINVFFESDSLDLPWTGGMNSLAFYNFDLDRDGVEDLLAFEKNGNRLLPFVYREGQWIYTPEYCRFFPDLHDWVIFKDYDNDGKKDIFTYGLAGIRVFRNISAENIEFELITEQLQSYYYNGYVNIYASPDDYLVVEDVDGDGDMDILNFWVLGKYVHEQLNWAVENQYANGYLDFRLEDECWGKFSEGSDNNEITLLSYCQDNSAKDNARHVGSTMMLKNLKNDTLKDLILGDIDYPELIYLTNGGTQTEALMVAQTKNFPNEVQPVHLYSMPLPSAVDVNGDSREELLCSPADPSLVKSENKESVHLYIYDTLLNNYTLQTTSFLQEQCIDLGSGCYPVLFDWNNDGLLDLFTGNYGYYDSSAYINGFLTSYYSSSIAYFENTGDAHHPVFHLVNEDFGQLRNLNKQALYPALGDLDADGQAEMICGCSDGTLIFVDGNQIVHNYQNISVSNYATPQLFDINKDGKLDLLIGNRRGYIAYYHNDGNESLPDFQLVTEQLGGVDVRDYQQSYFGYSVPCFFTWHDSTFLLCGNEQGNLYLYDDIDGNLSGTFHQSAHQLYENIENEAIVIHEGIRVGVAVGFLEGTEYPDLIVGNYAGGMAYFEGVNPQFVGIETYNLTNVPVYPNPANDYVRIDYPHEGLANLVLYDISGKMLKNISFGEDHLLMNVSNLKPSIYIGTIYTDNQVKTFKLVIIR